MNPIQKAYQHIQMDNQSKKEVLQDILSSHPKPKRMYMYCIYMFYLVYAKKAKHCKPINTTFKTKSDKHKF